jgi:pyruvate dehydrogenase E1 component alpha subunit
MLSRAFWRSPALPALPKRPVSNLARRSVTTDAASSHAEKEDVPAVSVAHQKTGPYIDHWKEDDKPFQVKLSDESFETYELDPPPYILNTTKAELKKMYYDMVSIRSVYLGKASEALPY